MISGKTKWEVKSVNTGHDEKLQEALQDGWEPFAVTQAGPVTATYVWLRKGHKTYINTGPG